MSQALEQLAETLSARFAGQLARVPSRCGELTFEVEAASLLDICHALRDEPEWRFEQLIDLTGVDYLDYGRVEWTTESATSGGFSRGKTLDPTFSHARVGAGAAKRFAVVYHLLSVTHNRRIRLRAFCEGGEPPMLDSWCSR